MNKIQKKFVIITGLSGAGKSNAAKILEDIGFFCIDNIPSQLIPKLAEFYLYSESTGKNIALVIDIREPDFPKNLFASLSEIENSGFEHEIIFLEASDEILVRRYSETRRKHPLDKFPNMIDNIHEERKQLKELRENADRVIDTSELSIHELKDLLVNIFKKGENENSLNILISSFGFRKGIPLNSDLVFDVRFLPNPHFVDELRPLTGLDKKINNYVLKDEKSLEYLEKLKSFLDFLIPNFIVEKKHYLTISIGCTGGKHRSVVISEELYKKLKKKKYNIKVYHRDIRK